MHGSGVATEPLHHLCGESAQGRPDAGPQRSARVHTHSKLASSPLLHQHRNITILVQSCTTAIGPLDINPSGMEKVDANVESQSAGCCGRASGVLVCAWLAGSRLNAPAENISNVE